MSEACGFKLGGCVAVKQELTNQARRKKPRPGFPGRSCTSSVAAIRLKPTAPSHGWSRRRRDLGRGQRSSNSTTVTIPTHAPSPTNGRTRDSPQRIFFSLNTGAKVSVGGATAPPNGGPTARPRRISTTTSEHSSEEGVGTPSPASHHVGVSGGGFGHHITPSWCEVVRGVVQRV